MVARGAGPLPSADGPGAPIPPAAPPPRPARRSAAWLARGLALLVGLAAVPALELGLRALNVEPDPPPRAPADWGAGARVARAGVDEGQLIVRVNTNGETRIRSAPDEVAAHRMMGVDAALAPEPGVLRVVALGGSATLGVPVEATPERTWPAHLERALAALGQPAEVLNLGGASFGSDEELQIVDALGGAGVGAVVLWSGNNEAFRYGLELWRENRGWAAQVAALARWRTLRLLRRALGRPAVEADPVAARADQDAVVAAALAAQLARSGADGRTLLPGPGEAGPPRRRDPAARAVDDRFSANLRAMVEAIGGWRTPDGGRPLLLLPVVPVHLGARPALSLPDPDRPAAAARARRALARARPALEGPPSPPACEAAMPDLQLAVDEDPHQADAWWGLGRCLRALGRPGADAALDAAWALDFAPGRPTPGMHAALRAMAGAPGVRVLDPPAHLRADAAFHDTCHLTADAQAALGRWLASELVSAAGGAP